MNRTETQLRGVLSEQAADVSDAQDFAARVDLTGAVARRDRRRRLYAVTGACAAAAVVAVAAATLTGSAPQSSRPNPGPAPVASGSTVVGVDWVLVDIGGRNGRLDLAGKHLDSADRSAGAWVELNRGGTALFDDGLNVSDNTYRLRGSALVVHPGPTTLAGMAGGNTDRETIVTAMDALTRSDPQTVDLQVRHGNLVLRVDGYVLTFRNGGPSHSEPTSAPSSTAKAIERIVAPNVLGDELGAARTALRRAGLRVRATYVTSATVSPGKVVAESPTPAQHVLAGTTITLKVAKYTSGSACAADDLTLVPQRLSLPSGDSAVGVAIRNTGGAACTLYGYPSVRIADAHGGLPFDYKYGGGAYVTKRPPTTVVLQPGGGLAYFVVAQYQCILHSGRIGFELDVRLPGMEQVKQLHLNRTNLPGFAVCSGNPKYLPGRTIGVSPIAPDVQHAVLGG